MTGQLPCTFRDYFWYCMMSMYNVLDFPLLGMMQSEAERLRHQRETKEEEFSKLRLAEEELIQVSNVSLKPNLRK